MEKSNKNRNIMGFITITAISFSILLLVVILFKLGRINKGEGVEDIDKAITYANNLSNNGLYSEAAYEYERILTDSRLELKRRINMLYILANLYMDNLRDYAKALAKYIKLRTLYPDNPYTTEINQRIVVCLEKLGRYTDAQALLQQVTSINPPQASNKVVASVGTRPITLNDLNDAINDLPESLKAKYTTPQGRLEFLRNNLITRELLYNLALREGLNKEPKYLSRIEKIEQDLLIQMAYEKEISQAIPTPTEYELKLIYDAKKDSIYKGKKFEDVRGELVEEYMRTKAKENESKLIQKLVAGEKIEIYPESLGISAPAIKFGGGE